MRRRLRRAAVALLALVGLSLGVAALATWRREAAFAGRNPPPGRLVPVGDARVHAIEAGAGEPAIVMIHGNPGTALDFAAVQQILAARHRTVAFDRPGYGWSDRPAAALAPSEQARLLRDAARQLGVERPVVVGFSFGGPVALAWAEDHPDEVRAVALIAAVGDPVAGHPMGASQALLAWPAIGTAMAWTVGGLAAPSAIEAGFVEAFAPEPVEAAAVARGQLHFARPRCLAASAHDWATLAQALGLLAARYGEVRAPVEILYSPDDHIVGPSHAKYLAAHLASANLVETAGAGHQMMYTRPDVVAAAVERAAARATR